MELQTREFQIREVNKAERIVTGRMVSYNTDINFGGGVEQYRSGVFGTPEDVKFYYGHNHQQGQPPIGKMVAFRETDDGPEGDFWVSDKTQQSREVWGLIEDDILNKFSVGYQEVKNDYNGDTVIRTKANLKEVSIVAMPADKAAKVTQVREDQNKKEVVNMTTEIETTSEDVTELRAEVTTLKREMATLSQGGNKIETGAHFRSGIEAYQAFLKGDDSALLEIRDYTGGTVSDFVSGEDWKGQLGGIVKKNRPLVEAFGSGPLADGAETVTYEKILSVTGDVSSQVNEGDVIASVQVATEKESEAVETFAAYSNLSFQAFQRVLTSSGQLTLERLAASYAKVTNNYTRAKMVAATPQSGAGFTLSSATASSFIGAVVDGIQKIDTNGEGAQADFVVVSGDVWLKMAGLVDTANRPVFNVNGDGSNTAGTFNVRAFVGTVVGLPIIYDSGLAAKSMYVASRDAVTSWESAGAPVRIEDVNVTQLFRTFALYGYFAAAATNENGLVKPAIA